MVTRSFRVFATKKDLETIFFTFQQSTDVRYYKCGQLSELFAVSDVTKTALFGINTSGSHINNQWLICPSNITPQKRKNEAVPDKHIFFIDQMLNPASIVVDFGGICQDNVLFPTEISTLWYENAEAKAFYDSLRKICRKRTKRINGYFVSENAYLHKDQYRFCTISIKSPAEYDLKVE